MFAHNGYWLHPAQLSTFFSTRQRFGRFSVRVSAYAIGASVFFDTSLFPLYPLFRTNRQHFGQKIFFREGKNIFSFCFFCGLFNCSYAREHIIYTLPFVFFLGRESFSSGAVFLSNRLKKDFERFVCKEKRRTFVTAKAIPARFGEELFRRARRDLFLGGRIRRRAFS